MSTDSFSTHSLSDCNSTILCATKTIQAMNRLDEEKLETAPDNPSMGDVNDITVSTRAKRRSDREDFRNSTERTTKVSQLIQYLIQLCQKNIIHTHTTDCPNTNPTGVSTIHWRIQQLNLFYHTNGATKTNNLMPNGMHNSGSRIR